MKRFVGLIVFLVCLFLWSKASVVSAYFMNQVNPQPQYTVDTRPLDSQPQFPVPVSKKINYWIVNCSVSDATTKEVDRVLENLNADRIAQTIVLCIPSAVPQPTAYAERFLRYMGLGMPDGDRKNNGLVFLVLQDGEKLDVHYAVGLGLPALTAQGLSPINRIGEDTYQKTKSLDDSVLAIAANIDIYARSKYQPSNPVQPVYGSTPQKSEEYPMGLIWALIGIFAALVLVSETIFSFGAMFGNKTSFYSMAWPFRLILFVLENWPSSGSSSSRSSYSSSSSSSSGHSGSGGGGTVRGN